MKKIDKKENQLVIDHSRLLKRSHRVSISIEVTIVVLLLVIGSLNVRTVLPWYGLVYVWVFLALVGLLAVCVTVLTVNIVRLILLMKKCFKEYSFSKNNFKRLKILLVLFWILTLVFFAFIGFMAITNKQIYECWIFLAVLILCGLITMVFILINVQLIWRNLSNAKINKTNDRKKLPVRLVVYSILFIIITLVVIFGEYTISKTIYYDTITVSDLNLELGQSEVRQMGKNGQEQIKYNLIFGFVKTTSQIDAVSRIIAKGTRRYQYMYCSDGSYRYYEADKFKDPNVGFTHQSPDYCAQNNQGKQTALADTPPPRTNTVYMPRYTGPTSTRCYSLYGGNGFECYSY